MVQIQKSTSSWRSSEDLTDIDFTQAAAELLGSNLDLSDDMSLIGMDNLFDDVEAVITDDRDIFMGCTEDSQLKNDIFMNYESDQGALPYNDLSPESVPYNDVTSPLHSSSDESQDRLSYSGGLTPDSDIMESDIMDAEEEPVCNESVIPLVALEITGAISPFKDTKRPTRRKAAPKVGGVRKRRTPVKSRQTKTVKARAGRNKQPEPDVQCIKVCPPTNEKTTFSPSTMFPTIMSALRTNPTSAVPLERLVKPKNVEPVNAVNPDILCIQTPPTTPVELKPSVMLGSPLQNIPTKQVAQDSVHNDAKSSVVLPDASTDESSTQVKTSEMNYAPQISENVISDNVSDSLERSDLIDSEMEVDQITQADMFQVDDSQNDTVKEEQEFIDQQGSAAISPKARGKQMVKIPSPTRMTTRGVTRRRPSIPARYRDEPCSLKIGQTQNLPSKKVVQTVEKPMQSLPQKEPVLSELTYTSVSATCQPPLPSEVLFPSVQNRTVSHGVPSCSKTLQLAKSTSVTVVSSTARLGQPTVTSHPTAQADHLPRPAKITAVPLTAIPARSTILGILPSTTRIRPAASATHPAHIKLQTVAAAPAQLQTTSVTALPGVTSVTLRAQTSVSAPIIPSATVSVCPRTSTGVPSLPNATAVRTEPPVQQAPFLPIIPPVSIKTEVDSDANDTEEKGSVASRNTEILHLLNKQTSASCVKMEEEPLPRSFSGYSSSSSSSSGSPAPPQSPPYHLAQTPAVVSIKEEMLSDFSDMEDDSERFKNLSPEDQARVRRRRHNNRVAAQRCRQRKRDHFQGLKKEIQEWECSNTQLRYEIHVLQKELKSLAKIWGDHTTKCETAMAMQKRKKKHKKSRRSETAASSSPNCSNNSATASATSTGATGDPSNALVPIVVN